MPDDPGATYTPTLLGVINLSPESMVVGSIVTSPEDVLERARILLRHGVAILDVGGRSITPDAPLVDDAEERRRLGPALDALREEGCRVSVDTWSPDTARAALAQGVELVNYTAEALPTSLLDEIAKSDAGLILTYMPYGDAYQMRQASRLPYRLDAILEFLAPRIEAARRAGVRQVIVDPNLGIIHPSTDDFEKIHQQLDVLWQVDRLRELGCPLMLYAARKPERLARIMMASAVLHARPEYVRIHEPETIQRLLAAAESEA